MIWLKRYAADAACLGVIASGQSLHSTTRRIASFDRYKVMRLWGKSTKKIYEKETRTRGDEKPDAWTSSRPLRPSNEASLRLLDMTLIKPDIEQREIGSEVAVKEKRSCSHESSSSHKARHLNPFLIVVRTL